MMNQKQVQEEVGRAARNAGRIHPAMKQAERRLKKLQRAYTFWAERKLELQELVVPVKKIPTGVSGRKSKTRKKKPLMAQAADMSPAARAKLIQELEAMQAMQ